MLTSTLGKYLLTTNAPSVWHQIFVRNEPDPNIPRSFKYVYVCSGREYNRRRRTAMKWLTGNPSPQITWSWAIAKWAVTKDYLLEVYRRIASEKALDRDIWTSRKKPVKGIRKRTASRMVPKVSNSPSETLLYFAIDAGGNLGKRCCGKLKQCVVLMSTQEINLALPCTYLYRYLLDTTSWGRFWSTPAHSNQASVFHCSPETSFVSRLWLPFFHISGHNISFQYLH